MDNVFVLQHPLVDHHLCRLRDRTTPSNIFRATMRRMSVLLAYEATQDLELKAVEVETPLARTGGRRLNQRIGLVPILRAGLGMVAGIHEMMPGAEVWHIGLYRDHATLQPVQYYNKLPVDPTVQVCLVLDPMLATGGSAVATVDILKKWGARRIKYVGIVAAPEGVRAMTEAHPDVDIYVAAIDDHLTPHPEKPGDPPMGYIVPGLGDAGDRQFGTG